MTSTSFSDNGVSYYPLYQFILERPKLYSALTILPDLVDFYQWINQQFPFCFTHEESKSIKIGELLNNVEKYAHVGYTCEKKETRKAQYRKICSKSLNDVFTEFFYLNIRIYSNDSSNIQSVCRHFCTQ